MRGAIGRKFRWLMIDGRKVAKYKLTEAELVRKLESGAGGGAGPPATHSDLAPVPSFGRDDEMAPPVPMPATLVAFEADLLFLTLADNPNPVHGDSETRQVVHDGRGPALS